MFNMNVLICRPRFGQKKNSILVDSTKKTESVPTATVSSVSCKKISGLRTGKIIVYSAS